jgi:tetratricopeptide (TPR) repeat protein
VITLARPELTERRPTWGAGHRNFTSLYLEPLSEQAMEDLLTGLVPGLPGSLRAQILARAEGVPLYAVETVRMLLDRGLLAQEGAVYRPTGEIEELEVPETLHALIAARLDGLSSDERRVLQDGAVLGKTFTSGALATISGRPEADIEPLLVTLVRKEVLSLQADPRSPEHGQYGFLQDLVRHVAYETLSRHERKTRHLAAAAYLSATLDQDEVAEVVASHLLEAYRAVPDAQDAGEIRGRARDALTRAAERAASLAAAAEAQRYFEQAAELTDDPAAEAGLLDRAGQMAWRANLPEQARSLLERAHAVFESCGDIGATARVSGRIAEIDFVEGHPQTAVQRLRPALETLSGEDASADVAAIAAQLGRFLILGGDLEASAPHLEHALELAEALDLPETFAQALNSKALLYLRRDRLREARILLEGALATALEHDLHAATMRAYNNLAVTLDAADVIDESIILGERAIEFARRVGDRHQEAVWVGGSVGAFYLVGRWDEALARATEASELATTSVAQSSFLDVVFLHCERGEHELARQVLTRYAAVGESETPETSATYAVYQARVLRAEGKLREALKHSEQALAARGEVGLGSWATKLAIGEMFEAAMELGDIAKAEETLALLDALRPGELTPMLRAGRARFRGRLAAELGEDDPDRSFTEAEEAYRDLGLPFLLAVTQLEHAEWLVAQGRSDEAEPRLVEARETFERLQARPWLDRLGAHATEVPA